MFDMEGKVIGINKEIIQNYGGQIGIGFDIKEEMEEGVIDKLKEFGEVRRGWIGVSIKKMKEEIEKRIGMKEKKGEMIEGIIEN